MHNSIRCNGLSSVEKGTTESFEEIEATVGAACYVFPRPMRQCAESQRVLLMQCIRHSLWTDKTTDGCSSAEDLTGHQVQCTRTGRCTVSKRNGRNIPMYMKSEDTIKLWVKGEGHDNNTNPKTEELGTFSVATGRQGASCRSIP